MKITATKKNRVPGWIKKATDSWWDEKVYAGMRLTRAEIMRAEARVKAAVGLMVQGI